MNEELGSGNRETPQGQAGTLRHSLPHTISTSPLTLTSGARAFARRCSPIRSAQAGADTSAPHTTEARKQPCPPAPGCAPIACQLVHFRAPQSARITLPVCLWSRRCCCPATLVPLLNPCICTRRTRDLNDRFGSLSYPLHLDPADRAGIIYMYLSSDDGSPRMPIGISLHKTNFANSPILLAISS